MGNDYAVIGLYTVKDSKADNCVAPFAFRTDGEAIRAFGDSVVKGGTPLSEHPEDYFLYRIGHFNQVTGEIVAEEHRSLGCACDFKTEVKNV